MAKKTITKLKKKHRDYIWQDEEGDLWYWDAIKYKWVVLISDLESGFYVSDEFDHQYYCEFTRIHTSNLIEK